MTSTFRTDINGLRAWAVLLVVLFHFQIAGFSAGFLGVDVFFVISGYLMASILYGRLASGTLALTHFYTARIVRIYPALMVLCAAVLVLGWFLLMPMDYRELGAHVRESLLFSSNYRYLSEAGYFDAAAESKWLLHTWSLSVEWQFYLLYPFVTMLFYRLSRQHSGLLILTLVLAGMSLAWNQYTVHSNPERAFFGFPGRAWELLIGSAAFHLTKILTPGPRTGQILHYTGLAAIVFAACVITPHAWPGIWALLPTLGAAMLIVGHSESPLTRGRVWNWAGERSYSIYLWHWPVVVLLHYFLVSDQLLWQAAGIVVSMLLAETSYRLVEQPLRYRLRPLRPRTVLFGCFTILVAFYAVAQTVRGTGLPWRLPEHIVTVVERDALDNPRLEECLASESRCIYGDGPVKLVLIGDSHADAMVTAVEQVMREQGASVLFLGDSACLPLPGLTYRDPRQADCRALGSAIPSLLAAHPDADVLFVSHMNAAVNQGQIEPSKTARFYFSEGTRHYTQDWFNQFESLFLDTLCSIQRERQVWLTRPVPQMPMDVPTALGRRLLLGQNVELGMTRAAYDSMNTYSWRLQDQAANRCGVNILDVTQELCDETTCFAEHDGKPIYRDQDHLSEDGNKLLLPILRALIRD